MLINRKNHILLSSVMSEVTVVYFSVLHLQRNLDYDQEEDLPAGNLILQLIISIQIQ